LLCETFENWPSTLRKQRDFHFVSRHASGLTRGHHRKESHPKEMDCRAQAAIGEETYPPSSSFISRLRKPRNWRRRSARRRVRSTVSISFNSSISPVSSFHRPRVLRFQSAQPCGFRRISPLSALATSANRLLLGVKSRDCSRLTTHRRRLQRAKNEKKKREKDRSPPPSSHRLTRPCVHIRYATVRIEHEATEPVSRDCRAREKLN